MVKPWITMDSHGYSRLPMVPLPPPIPFGGRVVTKHVFIVYFCLPANVKIVKQCCFQIVYMSSELPWLTTGPARLINTTDMPPVVFFNVSAHFFLGVKTRTGGKHKHLETNIKNRRKKWKHWNVGKIEHFGKLENGNNGKPYGTIMVP